MSQIRHTVACFWGHRIEEWKLGQCLIKGWVWWGREAIQAAIVKTQKPGT